MPRERGKTKIERIRRYLVEAADTRYNVDDQEEPDDARIFSDTKSIGSLSQHLFESDEDERYYGTCNGYVSQPGSKSNLLLCSECDQKTRTCTYRPQTPGSYGGRYVEERMDDRLQEPGTSRAYRSPVKLSSPRSYHADQDRAAQTSSSPRSYHDVEQPAAPVITSPRSYRGQEQQRRGWTARDTDDRDPFALLNLCLDGFSVPGWLTLLATPSRDSDRDESPICELCRGNGYVVHCEHCDFSSEGDLICFRCQSDEGSSNGQICPRCERERARVAGAAASAAGRSGSVTGATSSSDEGKYPVDAVVKIQVNDRSIDVDSDETPESESSSNHHPQRGAMERLDTIVEAKGDTASENDEENGGTKLNEPQVTYQFPTKIDSVVTFVDSVPRQSNRRLRSRAI
ncbi:uncharacterized protein LOC105189134 [Harpegnathos saltator]|uniref:uncharacterized protein LOC105189134 n=1 Tax=Harpegnathos saltator TaxID=610380 RepID=UPI000DBEEB2F|nr:uncharacterized protein LOC105189134 [Harpegnathos saltator]